MDITAISIKADGMEGDAKRYQFWMKCEHLDLGELFDMYVVDEETKLKDVKDSYQDREEMKTKGRSVDNYIQKLKESMKPDLDHKYSKFIAYLADLEKTFPS